MGIESRLSSNWYKRVLLAPMSRGYVFLEGATRSRKSPCLLRFFSATEPCLHPVKFGSGMKLQSQSGWELQNVQ